MAADVNRNAIFLNRFGIAFHVMELEMPAVKGSGRFTPQRAHCLDRLVRTGAAHIEWNLQRIEFFLHPAAANSNHDAAVRQEIKRSELLGQIKRMTLGQDNDAG